MRVQKRHRPNSDLQHIANILTSCVRRHIATVFKSLRQHKTPLGDVLIKGLIAVFAPNREASGSLAWSFLSRAESCTRSRALRLGSFSVSQKADGERCLLLCDTGAACAVSRGGSTCEILLDQKREEKLRVSAYDCEMCEKRLLIFDVLMHKGIDVRSEGYLARLQHIEIPSGINAEAKSVSSVFWGKLPVLEKPAFQCDGVVLTSLNAPYCKSPLKLKADASADLRAVVTPFKTVILLALGKNGEVRDRPPISLTADEVLAARNGSWPIGEFTADISSGSWKFLRWRPDRPRPNRDTVVDDNWEIMRNGENKLQILRELSSALSTADNEARGYRAYCNMKKRTIIHRLASTGGDVLDVGVGAGGDLQKYSYSCFGRVVGVDIDRERLESARRTGNSLRCRFVPVHGDATNPCIWSGIQEKLNLQQGAIATFFFSMNEIARTCSPGDVLRRLLRHIPACTIVILFMDSRKITSSIDSRVYQLHVCREHKTAKFRVNGGRTADVPITETLLCEEDIVIPHPFIRDHQMEIAMNDGIDYGLSPETAELARLYTCVVATRQEGR